MKILIFTLGSRGDIQPYLALAVGLQAAGHAVTLATSREFTEMIQAHGVGVHPVRFSVQAFMQQPETQAVMKSGNPLRMFSMMREVMSQSAAAMDDFWEAARATDFVVQTGTGNGGVEAASQLGLPMAMTSVLPFSPTRAFPSFFLPLRFSLGGGYNTLTHKLMHSTLWRGMGGPATNKWRATLGLPPWRSYEHMFSSVRAAGTPWLFGYSPSVLPKPADWADYLHVTGYWFLDPPAGWQPPADLASFLESGPPPVYVGFGSMGDGQAERQTRLVLRALDISGQRGVLSIGWGGLVRLEAGPNVFFASDVPHAWLFPHMAAVVHHGGAGTTAAGLRAGVPSVITPFVGDQHAWADQVRKLDTASREGRYSPKFF
ncbi:MAG: glycosyltransferase, partial [Anaerolineales bacterium]